MYHVIENLFTQVVQFCIIGLEFVGVAIIIVAAAKALISYFRHRQNVRLDLAKGIALALELKLGSEVLRTAIVRDFEELAIAGAIVVLRAAITFLIHWEIKNEEARLG